MVIQTRIIVSILGVKDIGIDIVRYVCYTIQMKQLTDSEKRAEIKRILNRLTDHNRRIFMLMYSYEDPSKDINLVVDELSKKQIEQALAQVKNSYYKIFRDLKG